MTGHSIRSSLSLFLSLRATLPQSSDHTPNRTWDCNCPLTIAHCLFTNALFLLPPVDRNASSMRLYFDPRPGSGFFPSFFSSCHRAAWFHQLPLNSWDSSTYTGQREWMVVTLILLGHESSRPRAPLDSCSHSWAWVSYFCLFLSPVMNVEGEAKVQQLG